MKAILFVKIQSQEAFFLWQCYNVDIRFEIQR